MKPYKTYSKNGRVYIEANHRFSRIMVSGLTRAEATHNYFKAIGALS
jgi:hypothetical protein